MRYCYIIVDGLGYAQIWRAKMPFLSQPAPGMSIRPLRTLLAYSSGIYPSIWSGRYPEEHGVWSEFFFDCSAGPGVTDGLRFLPISLELQRGAKYLLLQMLARTGIHPKDYFGLPPAVERFFRRVASDYRSLPPVRPPGITMLDTVMNRADHSWEFVYTSDFVVDPPTGKQVAAWSGNDSLFYSLSDADEAGHQYGPDTDAYRRFLIQLDSRLQSLVASLQKQNPGIEIFLFSDHGMNPVRQSVNILAYLERSRLTLGRDYVAFLNSTLASFWFLRPKAEAQVREILARVPGGHILDSGDLARYHLRFPDNRYGDLLFLVDPGMEIVPNFMSLTQRPGQGMHGYTPDNPETAAFLAGPSAKVSRPGDVTEIFSLIQANVEGAGQPLPAMVDDGQPVAR